MIFKKQVYNTDKKSERMFFNTLKLIKENKSNVVSFEGCKFEDDAMVGDFLDAIPENSVVEELNFCNCGFSNKDIQSLLRGLGDCSKKLNLRKLSLKSNSLGMSAVPVFCKFIKKTPSLKELDLSDSLIGSGEAQKMLPTVADSNVEKIDFRNNNIFDVTLKKYSEVIAKRKNSLCDVNFEDNTFPKKEDLDKVNAVMKIKQSYMKIKQNREDVNRINIAQITKRGGR